PSSTSGTIRSDASAAKAARLSAATTASPAPAVSAAGTKSWPSRLSPLMAKKASPGLRLRLSMGMPGTDAGGEAQRPALMACAIASTVQSGSVVIRAPPAAQHCFRRRRVRAASRRPPELRDRGGDRLVVAEGQRLFADDLAGFMALAGDQQHVT